MSKTEARSSNSLSSVTMRLLAKLHPLDTIKRKFNRSMSFLPQNSILCIVNEQLASSLFPQSAASPRSIDCREGRSIHLWSLSDSIPLNTIVKASRNALSPREIVFSFGKSAIRRFYVYTTLHCK